jgi:CRISPR-associated endonuclease Cas1 subtype II
LESLYLSEIDILICETTDILISTMLLSKLSDENILTIFCDEKRLPKSHLKSFAAKHDSSLQLQRQIAWTQAKKEQIWLEILKQKITNQSLLLQAHSFDNDANKLLEFIQTLQIGDPSNHEAHAARAFFVALFGLEFSREKESEVNAALNYGYSLIMSLFAREIAKCGCVTQIGVNHCSQFNPFNLACDIMEPFRVIIDNVVFKNHYLEFTKLKRQLLEIFTTTYFYNKQDMYLSNIASDYTRKVIACMNSENNMPVFTFQL